MTTRTKILAVLGLALAAGSVGVVAAIGAPSRPSAAPAAYVTNDSHIHVTNYIQEGISLHQLVNLMDNQVGRAAVFGIPLQQTWSYRISQDDAPTYYLDTDAPLYYYSFTDAHIAMDFRSLTKAEQARLDPMITGFNPADMYAADHVRRVLETFPGVFEGIGEFTIHKEFVTSKIAGETPSVEDPALDRLLAFADEVGLVSLVHCDADKPFPKPGEPPVYLAGFAELARRHPGAPIIWAHVGVGRVVRPIKDHAKTIAAMLDDPKLKHLYIDLSWAETAKYVVATPEATRITAELITKHPDRFLFGTDEVAPANQQDYLRVFHQYQPLWDQLSPEVVERVRKTNYARIFDEARRRVRAWEAKHTHTQ